MQRSLRAGRGVQPRWWLDGGRRQSDPFSFCDDGAGTNLAELPVTHQPL